VLLERFFAHVIASFFRGLPPAECVRAWLCPPNPLT
jgi:hypothetical protein